MTASISSLRETIEEVSEQGPPDALENLVEKAKSDVGAAFQQEVLQALKLAKVDDPAQFHRIRAGLKAHTDVSVTHLDAALRADAGAEGRRSSQSDFLVAIADEGADLFHTADCIGCADITIDGHRETWPVRSKGFREWLAYQYYRAQGSTPNSQAIQDALGVIDARARFDSPERKTFVRIGRSSEAIYIDLGDEAWRAIEVAANGWRVIPEPPIRFRRPRGTRPLPVPAFGGSVEILRSFLNIGSDDDLKLSIAWLLAALRPDGPFPILILQGEQGSAKSTLARVLRRLIDPNCSPLRSIPRDERDLCIAADNGWVLAFDNLSGLTLELSDALCRLSTGGGFATRELYSDRDESIFDATRPMILNGIEELAARPDLADRAITLTLPAINDAERRTEDQFWADFEQAAPSILGALLDTVACALRELPSVRLERPPRMADFAKWVTAAGPALGFPSGSLLAAYERNRAQATEAILESDAVASAVRALMEDRPEWRGTATQLLAALTPITAETDWRLRSWPAAPHVLSGRLRRIAPGLRRIGINICFERQPGTGQRHIMIHRLPKGSPGKTPPQPNGASDAQHSMGALERHPHSPPTQGGDVQ